jgi:hypothetical protein
MRLISFILAIVWLFALSDSSVAQDRYSPNTPARPAPAARSLGLRLLTWPGKVAAPAAAVAPAPIPAPTPAPDARAQSAPALPTSIYDPAPPRPAAAPPARQALAQAGPAYPTARFYSLHRPYGQTPDAATLAPQFFDGASTDLAAPPPPPPRTVTTSNGRTQLAAPDDAN